MASTGLWMNNSLVQNIIVGVEDRFHTIRRQILALLDVPEGSIPRPHLGDAVVRQQILELAVVGLGEVLGEDCALGPISRRGGVIALVAQHRHSHQG